jgi:uncharacterized protein (DUF1015 family)
MATIVPFRGILYDKEKVGDISKVIAPPYDVIDNEYQNQLYERHPNNVVRLELNKIEQTDNESNNRYTRSAKIFKQWIDEGIFKISNKPAVYCYVQIYKIEEREYIRKGFFALVKLEDFSSGVIYPHEQTLSKPKEDRIKLLRECKANFSQVFSIYSDKNREIDENFEKVLSSEPYIDITDDANVKHKLWGITDNKIIENVVKQMNDKILIIADGHHRYEVALTYRDEQKQTNQNINAPFNYTLMYFTNLYDEGLTILPTHRLVFGLSDFKASEFLRKAEMFFKIEKFHTTMQTENEVKKKLLKSIAEIGKTENCFVVIIRYESGYYLFTGIKEQIQKKLRLKGISNELGKLDVTVLHSIILMDILKISYDAIEEQRNIKYTTKSDEVFDAVTSGKCQIGFLMNQTKLEDIQEIVKKGEILPQKSTFFYPKLLSGIVMRSLEIV